MTLDPFQIQRVVPGGGWLTTPGCTLHAVDLILHTKVDVRQFTHGWALTSCAGCGRGLRLGTRELIFVRAYITCCLRTCVRDLSPRPRAHHSAATFDSMHGPRARCVARLHRRRDRRRMRSQVCIRSSRRHRAPFRLPGDIRIVFLSDQAFLPSSAGTPMHCQ